MSEPKHTPGPWRLGKRRRWRVEICGPRWIALAKVVVRISSEAADNEAGLANANLIAAAPEMYAALNRLLHDTMYRDHPEASELAKKALAKAEGRVDA